MLKPVSAKGTATDRASTEILDWFTGTNLPHSDVSFSEHVVSGYTKRGEDGKNTLRSYPQNSRRLFLGKCLLDLVGAGG